MEIFHVMRAITILFNMASTCRTKGLDCIAFTLLHFLIWSVSFNARNRLTCMNFIRLNWMPIQIFDNFDWINFSFYLNLVWFHCLLDPSSDIVESNIDSCLFDSSIGGVFDCFQKLIIGWVEGYCESSVDNSSVYMCSEVNFTNVVIGDDSVVSWVRGVMGCHMI